MQLPQSCCWPLYACADACLGLYLCAPSGQVCQQAAQSCRLLPICRITFTSMAMTTIPPQVCMARLGQTSCNFGHLALSCTLYVERQACKGISKFCKACCTVHLAQYAYALQVQCCRSHARHMPHVLPHIMRQFEKLLETQACMLVACQGLHSTSMCVHLCLVWKAAAFCIWHILCLFSSCQCCGAHAVHVACVPPQMCGGLCGTWAACILLHCI